MIVNMRKHRLLWIAALAVALLLSLARPAYAYIDPGTTGSVLAMIAPFIAVFLAFLGFLIRPFRRFFSSIFAKLRRSEAELLASKEQPSSGGSPDDEKSREDSGEDLKG